AWRREAVELHARGPIHRIEQPGYQPFWAVIGHDAVLDIERRPDDFTNGPIPILGSDKQLEMRAAGGAEIRTLIHMDEPDHAKYRKLTNDWFKPASIRRLTERLDELSRQAVDKLEALGGEADFYRDIALAYPLQVILSILGLPEADYPRMIKLTQEMFGAEDPDLQRSVLSPEQVVEVVTDFYQYFSALTADRQAHPTADLATLIANGTIDDAPMPDLEKMGYYVIIATAGHDTTAAAMAGGLRALAEHPDQLQLLRRDPDLLANAVDEMIRWTAPVRHFMRTAQVDTEVAGVEIAKGDWLYLSYLAGNLDPAVFDDPLRFDISRHNADRHIAFGYGIHFCLGAQLARVELRSLFGQLVPRLESLELAGEPQTAKTTFVGGHKSVPIRYSLTSA
ncbi:MAG TPA: cytochrome P450, partial [Acidimicrobiia bacterium]|nr:cytochrome P450 [Acidimicrobiia bacterium]